MNKFTKQCVAAVASLAMAGTLCVAGAVVANSSAWADSTPSVDTTFNTKGTAGLTTDSQAGDYKSAPWMTDAPKSGSITIYKWKSETDNNGNQKKETAVKDAEFTIKKVKSVNSKDLDLTNYDSWVEVAKAAGDLNKNAGTVAFDDTFGTNGTLSGSTNANGVLRFKDLPLGLYQIQETKAPAGYSAAETKPFYMTLPMIQQVTTGGNKETKYNYAPFVDPKNVDIADSVKKTKDTTKTVGAGDNISYTITADLDKVKAKATDSDRVADEFKGYSVFDLAPAKYFESYDDVVKNVKVGDSTDSLKPTEDYEVSSTDAESGAKKKIEITFTDKGRGKLAAAANASVGKAAKVTVDLTFRLAKTITLSTNSVTNEGGMVPSHGTGTTPSEVKTKTNPKVDFATFKIKKVSSKDNSPLKDAKFMLFANQGEATACTNALKQGKTGTDLDNVCKAKASAGFGEKVTAKDTGLTEAYSVKRGEEFYAVETVAPAGYIRNPNVHPIKVDENKSEETITVENLPDSGNDGKSWLFNLPKTGAAGVIIFALAGMCLVAVGMFIFLRNRKKDEEQQAA